MAARPVRRVAAAAARGLPPVGEGSPWADPRQEALRAGRWVERIAARLARARRQAGGAAGAAPADQARDDARLDYFLVPAAALARRWPWSSVIRAG